MELDRKRNAIAGTFYGILYRILQIVFPFIIRTIFIKTIGIQYLGLNSLFTAVLQVLNLAELGVSSALVFSMYRPIAEQDEEKICQLMKLYKIYYWIIGAIVLLIGLCLMPFLEYLIKDAIPSDINIYILYSMQLGATVLSYWLYAYRSSILIAYQRNDILNIISIIVNFVLYIVQIIVLLIFENYYLYLCAIIAAQILNNIVSAIWSKRRYPQYEPKGDLPKEERLRINKKVRDLFTSKIGAVVNNSVDSIVISTVLGLQLLAVYQNYYYVVSAVMALFGIFFGACTAGIGNSLVVRTEEDNRKLLYNINYIVFMALSVCCACILCLYQPFMKAWVGDEYTLDYSFVILFAVYLYAEEAPRTLVVFKDAGGIWRHDRFRPLTAATINLILNIVLTPLMGLYGIILSTILAFLGVSYPWAIVNIDRYLFNIDIKIYLKYTCLYTTSICIIDYIVLLVCENIVFQNNWLTIFLRATICIPLSIVAFSLIFWRTDENKYIIHTIQGFLRK